MKWRDVAHAQIPHVSDILFGQGDTDVDDDGDAVGQGKVAAEFSFYHIEILGISFGLDKSLPSRTGAGPWRGCLLRL
jgi:hypothetical protein